MRALMVHESMFGNTGAVVEAVAVGMAPSRAGRAPSGRDVRVRAAMILSAAAGVLMGAASLLGLLAADLYRDPPSTASMFQAYDLVTLLVAVPLLAWALWAARRGSIRAQLVWVAMLAYTVYDYALYVFGSEFNAAFLLHVAVFAAAVAGLALALSTLDITGIAARFSSRTPARWIAGLLAFLALGLGSMWIAAAARFAMSGDVPGGSVLVETPELVHLGIALDLTLLVPAYALAALLLWRRTPWGYVLAATMLIAGTVHQLGYLVALPLQVQAGVPDAAAVDPGESPIAAAFLAASIVLLACVHGDTARNAERADGDRAVHGDRGGQATVPVSRLRGGFR